MRFDYANLRISVQLLAGVQLIANVINATETTLN